jgi:hypothetical protein
MLLFLKAVQRYTFRFDLPNYFELNFLNNNFEWKIDSEASILSNFWSKY